MLLVVTSTCKGNALLASPAGICRRIRNFEIKAHDKTVVVNTSGPWVDKVCGLSDRTVSKERKIGGTKGSHIIVDPFPGAPESALYVEAKSDGRPYFIVPWLGQYLIGTTDEKL
jgi:glycerol-3-phosphate dehydrogenase